MIVATAGHVDHGKTRLVHALTGIETDRLLEEQARGLTIDLGFAYTNLGGTRVGFVDVPGHIRFINNMLAGVAAVDFALIVIAADDGPMPQTIEHLAILNILGVTRGVIALTKVDRVDPTRLAAVQREISELVSGSPFANLTVIPVSSETGEGIGALANLLSEAGEQQSRAEDHAGFRLAIDRCFSMKGAGLVVTGSVFSGAVAEGDEVFVLPSGSPARVRGIRRQNEPAGSGQAGDRLALNLAGAAITRAGIHRGDWLASRSFAPSSRADMMLTVLPSETGPLRHWTPVHLHAAASHVTGRVAMLDQPRIEPGETGLVQLVLAQPVNLWAGDRIVVRDQAASRTIAGGSVVDPRSPKRGRARPERIAVLHALLETAPQQRLARLLATSGTTVDLTDYADAFNMTLTDARAQLAAAGGTLLGEKWGIAGDALDRIAATLTTGVIQWHREHPDSTGVTAAQLRRTLPTLPDINIVPLVLERLVAAGQLAKAGGGYAIPGQKAVLGAPEARLLERVHPILMRTGVQPPVLHDLARELGMPVGAVEKLLSNCARLGFLVRPVANRFFLPESFEHLRDLAAKLAGESATGTFTVKEFRDAANIGRNLSIEILEYLDRTGFTVRLGDTRKLQLKRGQ
ncbi:MAG: selenocysteine-specific translation elongation factor [Pseudomonadota bacterium]